MRIPILFLIFILCVEQILSVRYIRSKKSEQRTFTSCFEDLGCIDTTEAWYHDKYRPKNLEPLDRHTIRTEFLLMKNAKNNSSELVYDVMNLKRESIEVAGFKSGTCSIFVIHDFTSNGYTGWIKHLVLAFTRKTDCNIVSVDWQAGAEPPLDQAIANARVVALEAKFFLTLLSGSFSQSTDNVHLIGHGVGAHIAGYIGKYIKGIQRITGLDPTGPMFEHMPSIVRLDANDAKYVEILHTDNFNHRSQGGRIPHGHADFIINNAEHQPGCNDSSHMPSFLDLHRDSLQEGKILPACSHKRAFKYYIQALEDDECQFIGVRCDSYHNFQLGKCNNCSGKKGNCATFGLEPPSVTTRNNTYYVITNGKKPFCLLSYSVNITFAKTKSKRESEGYFEMLLVDVDDKVTNATNNIHGKQLRKHVSGNTYTFVFYALPPRLGRVKEAKVKWIYKSKKVCVMCDKSVRVHDIGIRRLTLRQDSRSPVTWLCPIKREILMKSGDYIEYVTCEELYGDNYAANHAQPVKSNKSPQGESCNATTPSCVATTPLCVRTTPLCVTTATTTTTTCATTMTTECTTPAGPIRAAACGDGKSENTETTCDSTTTDQTLMDMSLKASDNDEAVSDFKKCFDDSSTTAQSTENCDNIHALERRR